MSQTRQKRKQRPYLIAALLVIVLAGALGGVIYRGNRRSRINAMLFNAVTQRDTATATEMLEQGADANAKFDYLLMMDMPLQERLRFQWERLSGSQIRHESPILVVAVTFGDNLLVKQLLAHGAKPNVRASYENTALHTAVAVQDLEMVRELIAAGADVTLKNDFGKTPLRIAKEFGAVKIAALLRKAGSKI